MGSLPPGHLTGKTCLPDESQITWTWQVNNLTFIVNESENLPKDAQVHVMKLIYSYNIRLDKFQLLLLNLKHMVVCLKNPEYGVNVR